MSCGTEGIGKAIAIELARRKATVYITGRNVDKTAIAVNEIIVCSGNGKVYGRCLDLSSFNSIRRFATAFKSDLKKLDILIENAAYLGPMKKSVEGYEMTFTVNHLGHFLLFSELLPIINVCSKSRVVVVASDAHIIGARNLNLEDLAWLRSPRKKYYSPYLAYGRSKVANILFTTGVNSRFGKDGISAFAVHPGATNTNLFRSWSDSRVKRLLLRCVASLFFRSPEQGAQTIIYCATEEDMNVSSSAELFVDCKATIPHLPMNYREVTERLWELSEQLVVNMDV
ncbi:retinol dehydrogenase 12-like [Tubulanus polymorphus]|uniref:retinol dehydrogenase 12-like n=1 Tax=Tubulanus polymorphus TaxID=672921 RepID=UPI003DA6398B